MAANYPLSATGRALLSQVRRQRSELLTRRITRLDPQQRATLHAAVPILELLLAEPQHPDRPRR
jgi:hypothetical protein